MLIDIVNLMIKCHIFLYIISYDIISAIELKKNLLYWKITWSFVSSGFIYLSLFLGVYVMMLHLPLSFFGKANAAFGINLCKVYMNDDPKMTKTYIMANSNVVICVLEWGLLNVLNR